MEIFDAVGRPSPGWGAAVGGSPEVYGTGTSPTRALHASRESVYTGDPDDVYTFSLGRDLEQRVE
jgi:hypothetical protein